jgi:methylenetetrahydrofolate reductase (NADPH)
MTTAKTNNFQEHLVNPDAFTLTFELVPSRGGRGKEHNRILDFAKEAAADGRIHAMSITENAGGHPALSPEVLGSEIKKMGLEIITHFSCKDKNRNQMESSLFAWNRIGLHNLLVITGDYPQKGFRGHPKPVFDLDCVHVLDLLHCLNRGLPVSCNIGAAPPQIQNTSFFMGVALSPFKRFEPELMMQYYKLHRKISAGANFVITQVGFDARKFHEVLLYMQQNNLAIPVLGNVFVPNLAVVEHMFHGRVPGCIIPQKLYNEIQQEAASPDKGKQARLTRAAKLLAVLKGLGYAGAHLGGPGLTFADIDFVLNRADGFAQDWQACIPDLSYWPEDAFFYFRKDEKTGLNSTVATDRNQSTPPASIHYRISATVHRHLFDHKGLLYNPFRDFCLAMENSRSSRVLAQFEHLVKFFAFNCRNCGDCTLAELAYVCPQSGCAKYLLNGPCGGSVDGWCEVYPGKKRCLYVRVYDRLKPYHMESSIRPGYIPPRNWNLNNSSSWVNYFQGKDHTSQEAKSG